MDITRFILSRIPFASGLHIISPAFTIGLAAGCRCSKRFRWRRPLGLSAAV
jgi:hypothetical protein